MAVDSIMQFIPYQKEPLRSESQTDYGFLASDPLGKTFKPNCIFEVSDYSFNIEQTLSIGSGTTGAGAGKVAFNPFSITKVIDRSSPAFFQMSCSGSTFSKVTLALRKSVGDNTTTGAIFLRYDFKLVAVKTINYAHDDEQPKESIEFEYGALQIRYRPQDASGKLGAVVPGGWSRVQNKADTGDDPIT